MFRNFTQWVHILSINAEMQQLTNCKFHTIFDKFFPFIIFAFANFFITFLLLCMESNAFDQHFNCQNFTRSTRFTVPWIKKTSSSICQVRLFVPPPLCVPFIFCLSVLKMSEEWMIGSTWKIKKINVEWQPGAHASV